MSMSSLSIYRDLHGLVHLFLHKSVPTNNGSFIVVHRLNRLANGLVTNIGFAVIGKNKLMN